MNAYHELFCTKRIFLEGLKNVGNPRYEEQLEQRVQALRDQYPGMLFWIDETMYNTTVWISPKVEDVAKNNNILWAWVECGPRFILKSGYTEDQLIEFLNNLLDIDYDNGYGSQELDGVIAYKDGTWRERREYDGSEWWERYEFPTEPDWK